MKAVKWITGIFLICGLFSFYRLSVFGAAWIENPIYQIGQTPIDSLCDGTVTVSLDYQSGEAKDIRMILALYDRQTGSLRGVSAVEYRGVQAQRITGELAVTDSAVSVLKTMVWEDMVPLCEPYELDCGKMELYDTIPGAVPSENYQVMVNGKTVFVERYKDISYARFSFSGTAAVTVTAAAEISSYDISPHSYEIEEVVQDHQLNFVLTEPRKLILTVNEQEKLFLFADALEQDRPDLSDSRVVNIMDRGADNQGNAWNTAVIQTAIDELSGGGGGTLYFPNGIYKTATVRIRSNVTLYLESGAVLKGSANAADYQYPLRFSDGSAANLSALVCFDQAENAGLRGRGVVDGDGKVLRPGRDAFLVEVYQSKNICIEDVILRDPAAFNTHITYSDGVTVRSVKLVNDISVPNTDGIDPDCSRNVLIEDSFFYCSDDTISIKGGFYTSLIQDSYGILVRDNVFWTLKSAMKIGTETFTRNIYDVVFENNDVVRADRAVVCYVHDGGDVSDIQWVNNRTEEVGGDARQRLIDFEIATAAASNNTPGRIFNITIKDLYAEQFSANPSTFRGFDEEHQIKDVTIDNFVIDGVKRVNFKEANIDIKPYCDAVLFAQAPETYPAPGEQPYGKGVFQEKDGVVSIEAEHYWSKQEVQAHGWKEETGQAGFTGACAMRALPDVGMHIRNDVENTSPRMDYRINFTKPGRYYIWVRAYAPDTSADTFHVGLDGALAVSQMCTYGAVKNWYWHNRTKANTYGYLDIEAPGEHTLNVYMSEDGIYLDKIVLLLADSGERLPELVQTGHKGVGPDESLTDSVVRRMSSMRIEAEDMVLAGFEREENTYASNGMCVKAGGTGTASFTNQYFQGSCLIKVVYFDESDGGAQYQLRAGNAQIGSWTSDADLGSVSPVMEAKTCRFFQTSLELGDRIELEGTLNLGEPARVDYIEIWSYE